MGLIPSAIFCSDRCRTSTARGIPQPQVHLTLFPELRPDLALLAGRARRLTRGGEEIELTEREFLLLTYLIRNAERALSRDAILREVWGYGYEGTARTIDNFVTRLRRKIEQDPQNPSRIVTVRGFGYRFIPEGGGE